MVPSQALLNQVQTLVAADAASIGAATALKVHLAQAAFTPGPTLTVASFTEASFTGYAAISCVVGTAQKFNDVAGGRVVQLLEPANGFHWQTTATTGLPQTIYGYYLTDNGSVTLWASALFTTPITLTTTGDAVDIGQVRLTQSPSAWF